jgi:hypothetical protein
MSSNIVSQTTDEDGEPVYDIDSDKLLKILKRYFSEKQLEEFDDYINAIIREVGLEEYINPPLSEKDWINDYKSYIDYDNLEEARITPVGIPSQKYKVADWVYKWLDYDYDDWRVRLDDQYADMLMLLVLATDEDIPVTVSKADINNVLKRGNKDIYDGSADDAIKELLDLKIILPAITNEARVTPVAMGGLRSSDLFKTLGKYYGYDPEYFEDYGILSQSDLRSYFEGKYIVTELVALNIYQEILDFYNKYKKVVVDKVDYTKDFLNAMEMYERDPNNINDPNNLNEARVTPTTSMNKVSANYINLVNDSITKAITDIIKDNSRYVGNGFDIVKALLDNDKLSPLIEKFIKSKMMETNAEIVRNGVPDIVTRANVNTLTDNEMLDFVEDNKAVQQYISKLYWKSYLESIDIDAIKKIIKDRYYDPQYEQEYDDEGIEIIIYRKIDKTIYGEDIFPYADNHLFSDEFADVLERELPKEIFEARVTPVRIRKRNKYVSVETDEDGEKYYIIDKGLVQTYLESVIHPEYIDAVETFMDDEEGWEESTLNGLGDFDLENATEKDIEDFATSEMSFHLTSEPDEFPYRDGLNEARVIPVGMSKGIKRLSKNEFPIDHYQFEPHIHEAYEIQNLDSKDSTTIRKDFDILTNLFKKIYNQYNPTNEFNRLWVIVSYDNGQNNIFTLLTNGTIPTNLLNKKYPGYSWYDAAYVFPENHTLEDVLNNYI